MAVKKLPIGQGLGYVMRLKMNFYTFPPLVQYWCALDSVGHFPTDFLIVYGPPSKARNGLNWCPTFISIFGVPCQAVLWQLGDVVCRGLLKASLIGLLQTIAMSPILSLSFFSLSLAASFLATPLSTSQHYDARQGSPLFL